jgi:hypothetical protein
MREYLVTYTYRQWAREPRSPFASVSIVFTDPSAAHERALKLRAEGHHNVTVTPQDKRDHVSDP